MAASLLRLAHFPAPRSGRVAELAPATAAECLLSTALASPRRRSSAAASSGSSPRSSERAAIGMLASALCFGAAHLYEEATAMLLIALFGALFRARARLRGSLVAGVMAHAWHDLFPGITLAAMRHVAGSGMLG